jgi:starch phosphorylase
MSGRNTVKVAFFSMEIALDPSVPTYSGGLGVLAGDMLRSAADLGVPMAGVTLVYRRGYFRQCLDATGNQTEEPAVWHPEDSLEQMEPRATVEIEGRQVVVRAWRAVIRGVSGHEVPVYFLDTCLPENSPEHQALTDSLYGGDDRYRLCQEVVLGMGGVGILRALGHTEIESYHMNEGHSALLTLALLEQRLGRPELGFASPEDVEAVRSQCIFTTHTPVPAGHDQFPRSIVDSVLGAPRAFGVDISHCCPDGILNMTYLALRLSHYINGVAMRHGEVSHGMFPNYPIRAITNGVHAVTWTSPAFRELYERHIPEWRRDNLYLRYAVGIPLEDIRQTHHRSKRALLEEVRKSTGERFSERVLTIGFARRAAAYKRADMLFANPDRLKWITTQVGPLQVIFAGKAHPHDEEGKAMIRRVFESAAELKDNIHAVYIPDYDMRWGQWMTSGVDVWLNTPQRPYEASGTSGMKASLNGVPSLSVLDGWWIEGCIEGATGWAIGGGNRSEDYIAEVASLYDKLELVILPMFYGRPNAFNEIRRYAIALNGSFFNTQRVLDQYVSNAYFPETGRTGIRGQEPGKAGHEDGRDQTGRE